jgi:hypothetical protein
MEGYCTACQATREIKNLKKVVMNFETTFWGTCSICSNVMSKKVEDKSDQSDSSVWKMNYAGIEIERPFADQVGFDYEINFRANDGVTHGSIAFYLDSPIWARIGKALISFSRKSKKEYSFKINSVNYHSESPLNHRPFFLFHALKITGAKGNAALQITMNYEKYNTTMGETSLAVITEPSAIERLGKLLIEFSHPKYELLKWSVEGDVDELIVSELWPWPKPEPTPWTKDPWIDGWSP